LYGWFHVRLLEKIRHSLLEDGLLLGFLGYLLLLVVTLEKEFVRFD
jgi:hypothetical protein